MSFSTTGMKKTILYIITTLASFFPVVSFAALNGVKGLITDIGSIINSLIPVLFGLALIFFFWGLAQFILHSGEEKINWAKPQKKNIKARPKRTGIKLLIILPISVIKPFTPLSAANETTGKKEARVVIIYRIVFFIPVVENDIFYNYICY